MNNKINEKMHEYLNESISIERRKQAEKWIEKNKKFMKKIDFVDSKGITRSNGSFISWKKVAEEIGKNSSEKLKNIIKAGIEFFVAQNNEMPPHL